MTTPAADEAATAPTHVPSGSPGDGAGRQIAVVGAGYMGGGIAQVLGLAGADVKLADVSAAAAHASYDRLLTEAGQFAADGLFPADAVERLTARLQASDSIEEAVAGAEFVMEAVPEQVEIKHPILTRISRANTDAVIASNTSTLSIALLAEAVEGAQRFLGVHFSNRRRSSRASRSSRTSGPRRPPPTSRWRSSPRPASAVR